MFPRKVICVVFSLSLALWIGLSSAIFSHAAEKKAEVVRWKFSLTVPETHFLVPLVKNWCAELSKASGGKVAIDMYYSSVLGTPAEHFDLIREGIAEMGVVIISYNPDRFQLSFF
ncbi:MAG: hypothetical protein ABIN58_04360, partial [candidate division WOR-3 bacterium]